LAQDFTYFAYQKFYRDTVIDRGSALDTLVYGSGYAFHGPV